MPTRASYSVLPLSSSATCQRAGRRTLVNPMPP
jgi:hypothetical protein